MSAHRHRRRRRSSGFDLVRLYEDDHHVLDEYLHEKRHALAGWAVVATSGFLGIMLALAVIGAGLWEGGELATLPANGPANPLNGTVHVPYPPDGAMEELSNPASPVLAFLLLAAALIVAFFHLAMGRNEAWGGAGERVVTDQPISEPSAFQQRLDQMVCIKMSRRPQNHRHRHHRRISSSRPA